jgi:hypothetical protein
MTTNLGGKARPRSLAAQRRQEEDRQRTLEVQRAQAQERREREAELYYELDVKKHELEQQNHELEKTKVVVDVLKHVATVITALLFILSYFGDQVIPRMRGVAIFGMNLWDWAVMAISLSLGLSLISLIFLARNPTWIAEHSLMRLLLLAILISIGLATLLILSSLTKMP